MTIDAFEKTSWDWQLSLFRKQVGEWLEYQSSRFQGTLPSFPDELSIAPWVYQLLKVLFWLILSLFLVWLGWRLWQEFNPYFYSWLARVGRYPGSGDQGSSRETSSKLLTRSQEFALQGNYREACRCIYLATLQQLHEKAIAPQQPSRTDGEYLQLLRSLITPIQPYETLITLHERICFDDAQMLPENYQQCRQAYQEIFQA